MGNCKENQEPLPPDMEFGCGYLGWESRSLLL